MNLIPTLLISFITLSVILRYWGFPLLFRRLTQFRVSSFSLLSVRGLEWRKSSRPNAVVPTLRVERAGWTWGGLKGEEVGLVILRLEGVSYRVQKTAKGDPSVGGEDPPRSSTLAAYKGKLLSQLLHVLIHHYPSLARIISLQVSDIRVIFDDLDGLELTLRDFRLGVSVDFEGNVDTQLPPSKSSSPVSPGEDFERAHPLSPEEECLLSPGSPRSYFQSFGSQAFPDTSPTKPSPDSRYARLAHARRRASHIQSRMFLTASQVWSRAIARAHGSVSFAASIRDIAVILPHVNPPHPMSARNSAPDIMFGTNSNGNGVTPKPSSRSLRMEQDSSRRPQMFASTNSFSLLMRNPTPRYALPSPEGGFEKLLVVEGESRVVFGLGFGPKKGLLGEDTLKTSLDIGKMHTSLGASDKLQELIKSHSDMGEKEDQTQDRKPKWGPRSMPRILLRAFESVSVSLSHLLVSHYLSPSTSQPVSANSSATDLTILTLVDDNECFTVSLDISEVSCQLSAADSTNNDRARNAFGTNPSPESKVRGIGFRLQWRNVALQCVSPGDTFNDKSQLIAVRQAEFEGLSTWRPSGWTREELLFASDPNLALIVGRASMASIDVAGDVQLFDELAQPWHRSRPRRTSNGHGTVQPARPAGLPPRIRMVLDVGHVMVLLADRVSEHQTTLSLASDGLHLSCFSGFSDVVGRRRDKATARSVFKQEDKLQQRRKEAGDEADYALPESMLKPQLRRQFSVPPARLDEEYALSMRADSALALEPMSLHLTLSGENSRSHKTYHLASIGRVHSTVSGDILGRQDVPPNASETASLDLTSLSCSVDLGIDQGIKINLWETAVLNALVAMAAQHNKSAPSRKRTDEKTSLCRLPSGVSARVSLGLLSVFVGHQDPNPKCPLKLTRGLWLQSSMTVEYAYYKHRSQAMLWRHPLHASQRAKLQLPEDITTQALAFFNHLSLKEGRAALLSFSPMDTIIKPIYNGQRFIEKGGTTLTHEKTTIAKEKEGEDFVGWEFRRPQAHTEPSSGNFANNVPPFEISDDDQAQRPLIRIPTATINWLIQRPTSELRTEHKLTSKVGPVSIASDISHIYSTLLALLVVRKIAAAWKTVEPASEPRRPLNLSAEINFPSVTAHFAFPLKEQLILYFGGVSVSRPADGHMFAGVEQLLAYVPSSREAGSWEELGRIKRLGIKVSEPASPLAISIDADALRVRIPVGYQLSKLVLNLNVTVKAVKLLALDLGQKDFSTVHKPGPEAPKNVPKIDFNIKHMSLEAKDNPIETNLNLIWRAGLVEQETRNALEDAFEQKLQIISEKQDAEVSLNDEDEQLNGLLRSTKLTAKHAVPLEEARYRLDWWKSRSWVKRIRAAKQEQRRREATALKHMQNIGPDVRLPVTITASSQTAPLFRAALDGVKLSVCKADMSLPEILKYMSDVSSPFDDDVEFSLMVPLQLSLSMDQVTVKLRDYPLPLIRVQPATSGDRPAFHLETPFIIAEELRGDDSYMLVPCDVIPKGCGASQAAPFTVQMAKTITPVKTYSRPIINIASEKTTEFTWGNSYGPAIQDFMRVVDSLSHAPRDPSPKVGFWDKFRLILHWRVIVNFAGPAHLHLKVTGLGAGFALSWRENTRLEIAQPNPQYETIQISANELLIAIPDLTALHDGAAIGSSRYDPPRSTQRDEAHAEQGLIERRYTKPCARFRNGVRVGFGFVFERTCRPWLCDQCGGTDNLLHRQCRIFDFKRHQEVTLRSPEAVERDEQRLGRPADSYEGFRSDYIHFSVSLVAPIAAKPGVDDNEDAEKNNSLHFSPKAFAHFFAWWKLFDHTTSLPVRQGKLFPDSPPSKKKFGRSLGTIKYRFDLAPVYVSHVYQQVSQDLWVTGKSQSLGIKARFGRFRADAHQRAQEKTVRHEKLHRTTVVVHKPFYAADLLLDNIQVKGIRADFVEAASPGTLDEDGATLPKSSDLPTESKVWFNFFDFIDADRKPLDRDPRVEIIDVGDCPQIFFSKRVKARQTTANDDDDSSLGSGSDIRLEMESSKFGHEKSHICYLGAADGVGPTQIRVTKERIADLEAILDGPTEQTTGLEKADRANIMARLKTLNRHLEQISSQERRQIDDDTFEAADTHQHPAAENRHGEITFENTFHVHCPRVFFNNASRNIVYKYFFSNRDRKREEYTTSHASLRGIRDGLQRRLGRAKTGLNQDDLLHDSPQPSDIALEILKDLERVLQEKHVTNLFKLPFGHDANHEDLRKPLLGLPSDCIVKPKNRFLALKPQIALRSEIDDNAIVLLAVEEVSFKEYAVLDELALDDVTADVLNRHYVSMQGLQAFYPSEVTMQRKRSHLSIPRGLDFVPLEIFLDVRSEATDYDRIILKTDITLAFDRFNHLRMPRGLEWPDAKDEDGEIIRHLRVHQDLTTVIVPRLTMSATSKHYTALYDVVTDLLMYQDPDHRHRSDRIDSFVFAFDRKDRDPQQLIMDLFSLQQSIRSLTALQRGYEANADLLTEEGKGELFKIRTDQLEATEQLFTVFAAIAVNQSREDARAALKSASRMDVRVGGIAWHMLQDNLKPLVKLDIEGTLYSHLSNKDGSTDSALAIGDLSALNSDADAIYPEVMVRYQSSAATKRQIKESFASASWSILAPVGGISIVRHLAFYLHPVRFKLEERLGHEIVDYIFNRVKPWNKGEINALQRAADAGEGLKHNRPPPGRELPPIHRTQSTASVISVKGSGELLGKPDAKFTMVPIRDAAEMKRRASANRTFIRVIFGSTSIVLSYKSDEHKKHGTFSMPDCLDFKLKTPEMMYNNKVWGYEDVFEHVKRDIRSYAWSQTGDLLSQIIKKTSVFRSKKNLKQLAGLGSDNPSGNKSTNFPPSRLRYTVEPPTPMDDDVPESIALARAVSRVDPSSPLFRALSWNADATGPSVLGVPMTEPSGSFGLDDEDTDHEEHRVKGAVKGFLGKLRPRPAYQPG